jgi:hypothetical protein
VFTLLVGFGSWLVGSPSPGWFPSETGWYVLNLVAGTALVPLWLKLGFNVETE